MAVPTCIVFYYNAVVLLYGLTNTVCDGDDVLCDTTLHPTKSSLCAGYC